VRDIVLRGDERGEKNQNQGDAILSPARPLQGTAAARSTRNHEQKPRDPRWHPRCCYQVLSAATEVQS
jgi:hypothetical protein